MGEQPPSYRRGWLASDYAEQVVAVLEVKQAAALLAPPGVVSRHRVKAWLLELRPAASVPPSPYPVKNASFVRQRSVVNAGAAPGRDEDLFHWPASPVLMPILLNASFQSFRRLASTVARWPSVRSPVALSQ